MCSLGTAVALLQACEVVANLVLEKSCRSSQAILSLPLYCLAINGGSPVSSSSV